MVTNHKEGRTVYPPTRYIVTEHEVLNRASNQGQPQHNGARHICCDEAGLRSRNEAKLARLYQIDSQ